ncbi:MAG: ABC transporter permease, partial [Lachnospiraceae bacterium]|nr:ABC transporter permease [Lachnospiraceae bacterium]
WMLGFTIIPLLMVVYYGLTSRSDGSFTLDNIRLIASAENLQALWLSIRLSLLSTLLCLLIAYPLAMILRNMKFKNNSLLVMLFIMPMWINSLLRIVAWQNILERNGVLNTLLQHLHLPALNIINSPVAIVLGMVYDFLPFMILPLYNTLVKIDENVINAAHDLGAGHVYTFARIILPLSLPGVISGITMVFVPSLTTFVISDILGGSKVLLIGNVIEQQFQKLANWHSGSGLSLVLMLFVLLSMALVAKYDKGEGSANVW